MCRGGHGGVLLPTFWVRATAMAVRACSACRRLRLPTQPVCVRVRCMCMRRLSCHCWAGVAVREQSVGALGSGVCVYWVRPCRVRNGRRAGATHATGVELIAESMARGEGE